MSKPEVRQTYNGAVAARWEVSLPLAAVGEADELRAALAEKMILDWDYLPLPDLMEGNAGEGGAKKGKGKKK